MARIQPLPQAALPQYKPIFQLIEQNMGFVPSSLPTMARVPVLFDTFGAFAATVMNAGLIEPALVQLIAREPPGVVDSGDLIGATWACCVDRALGS